MLKLNKLKNQKILEKQQLDKTLLSNNSNILLDKLVQDNTIQNLFPEVYAIIGFGNDLEHKDLWKHTKQVILQCEDNIILKWTALFHDIGKPANFRKINGKVSFWGHELKGSKMFEKICQRTKLWDNETQQKKDIKWLIANSGRADYSEHWTDSAVRRLITESGNRLELLIKFTLADITSKYKKFHDKNNQRMAHLCKRIEKIKKEDDKKNYLPKGLGTAIIEAFQLIPGPEISNKINLIKKSVDNKLIDPYKDVGYYIKFLKSK